MRLWKCTVCGRINLWGPTWDAYSSILIDDECPRLRVITCSAVCKSEAEARISDGRWKLPEVIPHGYSVRIKSHKGYRAQPEQRELLRIWNEKLPDGVMPMPAHT
jgi:hypothetical protein